MGVSSPPLELESNAKDKDGKEEIKDVETIFEIEGREKKTGGATLTVCIQWKHLQEPIRASQCGRKEGREDPNTGLMAW